MHTLIVGISESGKTLLAQMTARELQKRGKRVAVLDTLGFHRWGEDAEVFDDPEEFIAYLKENRSVYAFVDESGNWFNEGRDSSYAWLTTAARHWGHSTFLIAQRAIQVPRTMRDQCTRLFAFTSSVEDGKILAAEYNHTELLTLNKLPQFEFLSCTRFTPIRRGKIVEFTKVVYIDSKPNRHSDDGNPANRNG